MSEKEQKNTSRKSSNVKSIRTHTVDKKDTSQRKSVVKSKKDLKRQMQTQFLRFLVLHLMLLKMLLDKLVEQL